MKKKFSLRRKITIVSSVLFFLGYVVMMLISNRVMKTYITKNMTEQFIHEDTQLAKQASIILEMGGDVPELQKFVEDCVSENDYIAYAVVVDSNVSAIAHSDTQKIGKSYADDTSYSVPAAQKGEIMTSQFWADVQQAWTYDVMCPIYVNGTLYGAMDVGIFNSAVDSIVNGIAKTEMIVAIVMIALICTLMALFCESQLKPISKLVTLCGSMGKGDFSIEVEPSLINKRDEIGTMAEAMNNMKNSLKELIQITNDHAGRLLLISEHLNSSAENTQGKASDIVEITNDAVSGTEQQTELTKMNSQMTHEINRGMEDITTNISHISSASTETAQEAKKGADKLDVVVNQMTKIEEKVSATFAQIQELSRMSDVIQNVVQLIAEIASQTNLLALNASIEAARAGEQGRGFSVVAGEVGNLAEESRKATEDITKIIVEIQTCIEGCVKLMEEGNQSVKDGMELATETKESFDDIIHKIDQVSEEMLSVSAVTEEVTSGTNALFEAIDKISSIADTVSGNTRNVSDAARTQEEMMDEVIREVNELSVLSKELRDSLTVFKIEAIN